MLTVRCATRQHQFIPFPWLCCRWADPHHPQGDDPEHDGSVSQLWSTLLAVGQIYSFPQETLFQNQLFFCRYHILRSPSPAGKFAVKNLYPFLRRKCWQASCVLKEAAIIVLTVSLVQVVPVPWHLTYTWSMDMQGDSELNLLRHV